MAKIQNETAYKAAMERIEELLPLVDDDTPLTDKNLIELDLLSSLVEEYEEEYYPIKSPSLVDVIKLRMYEMGLNQVKLSELLEVSPSRISDYLTGRCEPTLKVAREISRKLNIDADIVLGI
ncbi:helix-turn-helix domain-containing protein [Parabacteroides pacaensis]|uniref:helix-turn-helix domain-containing protein n=1 Tax=Parabacteroides pacaensis TaxID=2086575 RepID=UPI000D0EFAB0|nr:helix-turn-helix domain-containing protein [Parabacteroides pacaensis]